MGITIALPIRTPLALDVSERHGRQKGKKMAGKWHNPHAAYAPLGYVYKGDQYCLSCIAKMGLEVTGDSRVICCVECVMNDWATAKGIADRHDEWSYDSDDFPKSIAYHDVCQSSCSDVGCEYNGTHNVDCPDDCEGHCAIDCPDDCDDESHCNGEHHEHCGSCNADLCYV